MDEVKGVKGEIDQRPKRFYAAVSVEPAEGGWSVALDGRAVRTPGGRRLLLPTPALAQAIAEEWRAQGERIDLPSMFNTRQAYGVLDRTEAANAALPGQVARYAETDLVCHLAEAPATLRDRQEAAWAPLRLWAAGLGVDLRPVAGVMPSPQPPAAITAVLDHAARLDEFRLAGLAAGAALCGSAVLGLAVEQGRLTAQEAFELSRLEEAYQAERWGEDSEAKRRTERARAEARALDAWFAALR